jgi:putative transposase
MPQSSGAGSESDGCDFLCAADWRPRECVERDRHLFVRLGASPPRRLAASAPRRFSEWIAAGVFAAFWRAGLLADDALIGIDWRWLAMDGAMGKAPLGGDATGRNPTDRGKLGSQRSVLTDRRGIPLGIAVAGANRNDHKLARATLESLPVARPEPTAARPQGLCLDKGYDYPEIPALAEDFGFTRHLRTRGEETQHLKRHVGAKARRWVVERTHSWLHRFRRILIPGRSGLRPTSPCSISRSPS